MSVPFIFDHPGFARDWIEHITGTDPGSFPDVESPLSRKTLTRRSTVSMIAWLRGNSFRPLGTIYGFSGSLVVSEALFNATQATHAGTIDARLAADQTWTFQRYWIQFDWFGKRVVTRILVGPGDECLIGTELLNPHRLEIDYGQRMVNLVANPDW